MRVLVGGCVDLLRVDVLVGLCVSRDVLVCPCVDVLIYCVEVLMCWWCVDVLVMCWCVCVGVCWGVGVFVCWCIRVLVC